MDAEPDRLNGSTESIWKGGEVKGKEQMEECSMHRPLAQMSNLPVSEPSYALR
jgi:hypothetical protein